MGRFAVHMPRYWSIMAAIPSLRLQRCHGTDWVSSCPASHDVPELPVIKLESCLFVCLSVSLYVRVYVCMLSNVHFVFWNALRGELRVRAACVCD